MKKPFLFVFALLLALVSVTQAYTPLDNIAAIVEDGVILESDVQQRIVEIKAQVQQQGIPLPPDSVLREQVLERLILESIQLQMADRAGLRVSDDELNKTLALIAEQNGHSLSTFRQALEKQGLSYESVRQQVRNDMLINQLQQRKVGGRVRVTEDDVERFMNSEAGRKQLAITFHLGHILIANQDDPEAARARAEQLVKQLRNGADFKQMAIRYSAASNALEGGDMGWRKAAQLPSVFAEQALTMNIGDISDPIEAGSGWHILKMIDKRGDEKHIVPQTRVRHILITPNAVLDREQARLKLEKIRERILAGESFAELARTYSDDPGSAVNGGDLDWVSPGQMVPEFEKQMENTAIGAVSPVFETPFGWHILKVEARRKQDMSDEFRALQARNALYKRKFDEELELWLQEIRQEAYVDIKS